jgi:exocyst complex component 4
MDGNETVFIDICRDATLYSITYKRMSRSRFFPITSEDLRTTPERLETLLNGKHFLTGSNMLVHALKLLNSKDMMQIGALDDIRRSLNDQKTVCVFGFVA